MARPTDPAKLAALRARQAANSRAYRARKAAERAVSNPEPAPRRKASAPSSEQAVQRIHQQRAEARTRRFQVVGGLTSARNPRVSIYTPREAPTAPATVPVTPAARRQRIKVIRELTNAQKLQNVGRNAKARVRDILDQDGRADSIRENLSKIGGGQARFDAAIAKLSSVSQQTLAILFQYEGGEGDFQSALTQLAYPREQDPDDALGRIETLAEVAQRGELLYGPKAVGRLRV